MKRMFPIQPLPAPRAVLVVKTENNTFYGNLTDTGCAKEFVSRLSPGFIKLELCDGEDKYSGVLPWEIAVDGGTRTAAPGDVVICGKTVAICRKETAGVFEIAAHVHPRAGSNILTELGDKGGNVSFNLEWEE